jgi:hypothetical protein
MAEFSKQWCEIWDPSMPHDFDIEDIIKDMNRDRYYPIVCEGFGFNCIHKDAHGNIWLSYGYDKDGNSTSWRRYKTVLLEEKKKTPNNENCSIQRHS